MKFISFSLIILLSGCGTLITVPINPDPLSSAKSTLVVLHDQGFTDEFPVFLDKKELGKVTAEKPLRVEIEPGFHEIYTSLPMNIIDRVNTFTAEKGKTHFFKIRFELGMWVSSVWTEPTASLTSYQVKSHGQ